MFIVKFLSYHETHSGQSYTVTQVPIVLELICLKQLIPHTLLLMIILLFEKISQMIVANYLHD